MTEEKDLVILQVTTVLEHPRPVTVDLRGEFRSNTILEDTFYLQHFSWHDDTDDTVLATPEQKNLSDPGEPLSPTQVITLQPGVSHVTTQVIDEVSPLCDPLIKVRLGHEYSLKLRSQRVWWVEKTIDELFGSKEILQVDDLPKVEPLILASCDELRFMVRD